MTHADFVMAEIRRLSKGECLTQPAHEDITIDITPQLVADPKHEHEQIPERLNVNSGADDIVGPVEPHPYEERLANLEAEVHLLREAIGDLINIMRRYEDDRSGNQGSVAEPVVAPDITQPKKAPNTSPDKLAQLNDEIPYKLIGQLFLNDDGKKAKQPVFKLEFMRKGQSASGKDKGRKYQDVHCGLYDDYGHDQLNKALKMPANKTHKADIAWIDQKLTELYDEAQERGTLEHTVAGFFQRRKTQEILHHVVVHMDVETGVGRLIFNFGDDERELPFTMAEPKAYQPTTNSADMIYYFNVKDIRRLFDNNHEHDEGDDYDDE